MVRNLDARLRAIARHIVEQLHQTRMGGIVQRLALIMRIEIDEMNIVGRQRFHLGNTFTQHR